MALELGEKRKDKKEQHLVLLAMVAPRLVRTAISGGATGSGREWKRTGKLGLGFGGFVSQDEGWAGGGAPRRVDSLARSSLCGPKAQAGTGEQAKVRSGHESQSNEL
jgi:hypothetical protein